MVSRSGVAGPGWDAVWTTGRAGPLAGASGAFRLPPATGEAPAGIAVSGAPRTGRVVGGAAARCTTASPVACAGSATGSGGTAKGCASSVARLGVSPGSLTTGSRTTGTGRAGSVRGRRATISGSPTGRGRDERL
ncbi:hypothetical protein [Streptomyces sp. NRRL WC-3742]|uniref:hypothetical protein n=1 Tax=Streptomyces sp. NRRL WC-3742 TaxID=1463934 RepID=UPI00131BD068|nr:hypothetical protein [Streptomyces sp. NRRL WC-3742]